MNIRGVRGNDAIQIENATHIWIDHNTMSSTIENNPDFYDGMLDITHAGDYITVSWNIIRNHWKTSLVGHSDGNAGEDVGHLRVTYHHNWFDRTFERSPRVRFGETVHVFNNYYSNINNNADSYAIASVMNAGVLVEGNVFENVQQACWSASGYADSDPGRLVARNNSLTNSGPCEVNGTVAAHPVRLHRGERRHRQGIRHGGCGRGQALKEFAMTENFQITRRTLLAGTAGALAAGSLVAPASAAAGPDGFASVNALGQNGTTGGAAAGSSPPTTAEQFLDYIDTVGAAGHPGVRHDHHHQQAGRAAEQDHRRPRLLGRGQRRRAGLLPLVQRDRAQPPVHQRRGRRRSTSARTRTTSGSTTTSSPGRSTAPSTSSAAPTTSRCRGTGSAAPTSRC